MGAHLRSHLREQVRVRILAKNGEVARCVIGKPRRYCQACLHSPHDSPCAEMVDRQDNGDRPCGCEWAAGPAKAETPRTPATTPTKETP